MCQTTRKLPSAQSHIQVATTHLLGISGRTTLTPAEVFAIQAIQPGLATRTWSTRGRLWAQLNTFAATNLAPVNAVTAVWFLSQLGVSKQTTHTYAKHLHTLLVQGGQPTTAVSAYMKALVAQGATIPMRQAAPLTREQLQQLLRALDTRTAATAALAYKTCSRWEETAGLRKKHFYEMSRERIVIYWAGDTKTSRKEPCREDLYTVVVGDLVPFIEANLKNVPHDERLTNTTASQLTIVIQRLFGKKYSSHSLKAGAITALMKEAAKGAIPLEVVQRLAKHKQIATTLGYARNVVDCALALGSQSATLLL